MANRICLKKRHEYRINSTTTLTGEGKNAWVDALRDESCLSLPHALLLTSFFGWDKKKEEGNMRKATLWSETNAQGRLRGGKCPRPAVSRSSFVMTMGPDDRPCIRTHRAIYVAVFAPRRGDIP